MSGLFDGVVHENPLFVDNSERYAKRAELARDEAVISEYNASAFSNSARNSSYDAKIYMDKTFEVSEKVKAIQGEVTKDKNIVSQDKVYVKDLVSQSKVVRDEIQVSVDAAEVTLGQVHTAHQCVEADKKITEGFKYQAQSAKDVSVTHSNSALDYRNQASVFSSNASKSETEARTYAYKTQESEEKVTSSISKAENTLAKTNAALQVVSDVQVRAEALQGQVLVARDETELYRKESKKAAASALSSEVNAKGYEEGSEEYYKLVLDLYTDMKEGVVYRGTWNPKTNSYPNPFDTNSAWDVITGQPEGVVFDGKLWSAGDKVFFAKEDKKYYHLETSSAVHSVNGKVGSVVLDAEDVGALSLSGGKVKGPIAAKEFQVHDGSIVNFKGDGPYAWGLGADSAYGILSLDRYENGYWQDTPLMIDGGDGVLHVGTTLTINYEEVYHPANKPTAEDVGAVSNTTIIVSGNTVQFMV